MNHKPKKSMGQNFLKSESALREIIKTGEISKDDIILEIGPGKGALTKKLLEKSNHVFAVEKDASLVEFLKEKFEEEIVEKKLILIEGDILALNVTEKLFSDSPRTPFRECAPSTFLLPRVRSRTTSPSLDYKIIANIPYNITGAILRKFLSAGGGSAHGGKKFLTEKYQPNMMILLVQLEVAKRIIARDGKESILSISVKAYGNPEMIMKVPARYFSPAPKVDSAVIAIKNISRDFFEENNINEEKFWRIIHAGFLHRRKKLASNLKNAGLLANLESLQELKNKRAEDLSLSDWLLLTK